MEISDKTMKFIMDHIKDDPNALRLKYSGNSEKMGIPVDFALMQIEARRRTLKKLPTFLDNPYFIFPDSLAAEQASNEAVARFHSTLMKTGSSILDLTAGLGIDDMIFAMNGMTVTACEIDCAKSMALTHNVEIMGLKERLSVINVDSMDYVRECKMKYDVVYSDPARRATTGKRVLALSDCQPDVLTGMNAIMKLSDRLMIKCSPLLDLSFIRETVDNLSHIYVVCLKGECKEVLIDIDREKEFSGVTVVDMDMKDTISRFECLSSPIYEEGLIRYADNTDPCDYKYLYEPNSGVMKTGAWEDLSQQFPDLWKAECNTHLFFSDTFYEYFPGRILAIDRQLNKKTLKGMKGHKYNIVARNYPLSAQEVAKKYYLNPGDKTYLYAFRYKGKPICLLAESIIK